MKNTFGNSFSVTLFGESHGPAIGAVLDGVKPGEEIDTEKISALLKKRKGAAAFSTKRNEKDEFKIVSGLFEGKTTGTPLCILIENTDTKSADYSKMKSVARPSHADYAAFLKYHGYNDYRGGGHFSGRITAALTAAGAVALQILERRGVNISTHILSCGDICDRRFENFQKDFEKLSALSLPVLDDGAREKIEERLTAARKDNDSGGGVLATAVTGLPGSVGEPWFDTVEGVLSHMLFSVPAVKGVSFGAGFDFGKMTGSKANDPFEIKNGKVVCSTNRNGGINGGITNAMPIIINCAVKPTPSIYKTQKTIDFEKNEQTELLIEGRHDPAIIHKAAVVVTAATAIALLDLLSQRFGTDLNGV